MFASIDELKLNRFKPCRCIKPKDLYYRIGHREVPNFPSSEDFIPTNMDKLDALEFLNLHDSSSEPHEEKRNEVSEES